MGEVTDVVVTREEMRDALREVEGRHLEGKAEAAYVAAGERKVWRGLLRRSREQEQEERKRLRAMRRTTRKDAMRLAQLDRRPPAASDRATSRAAAREVREDAPNLRVAVLVLLLMRPGGMTDQQIQEALGLDADTGRARRWELSERLGLVVDSGRTRPTRKGNEATVWVAWKHAKEELELDL